MSLEWEAKRCLVDCRMYCVEVGLQCLCSPMISVGVAKGATGDSWKTGDQGRSADFETESTEKMGKLVHGCGVRRYHWLG